jgi:hypothetical protein
MFQLGQLSRFHAELALYPHGVGASAGSDVRTLYDHIGKVSMVTYRADLEARECVLRIVSNMAHDDKR